jgi:methionyl aminopeptidase
MIVYKSREEIEKIRQSNQIVARILEELKTLVKPGIQTRELDDYAERRCRELGALPAFKGYRGFPASLCTSINEEIVHGIPSSRKLKEGDIISLDFGTNYRGFYGDAAITYPVGEVSLRTRKLIETAERAFFNGIVKRSGTGYRTNDRSGELANRSISR